MITLEVHLNGKKLCTAGVRELGTLHAQVTRYRIMALRNPEGPEDDRVLTAGTVLSVGGIRITESGDRDLVKWVNEEVSTGDEITIRILESDQMDTPKTSPSPPQKDDEITRKLLERKLKDQNE